METTQPPAFESDWLLGLIVNWANRDGFEVAVNLNLGAAIITGVIISGAQYFEETGETFASNLPGGRQEKQWVADLFNQASQRLYTTSPVHKTSSQPESEIPVDNAAEPPAEPPPPAYIHLRNARMVYPSGEFIPGGEGGVLWRGKISAIDGFSLGNFRAQRT